MRESLSHQSGVGCAPLPTANGSLLPACRLPCPPAACPVPAFPARLLQVLLHVANPELRAQLETLQAADNGSDPLRYAFIVSQAQLVDSPAAATDGAAYSATATLEEGGIEVVVGVARADGHKCNRCWNYRCAVLGGYGCARTAHLGASRARAACWYCKQPQQRQQQSRLYSLTPPP